MILVILLVTLIPLVLVLLIVIYMFKRNKTNAVAAARERRNSSMIREARLQDIDKEMQREKEQEVNLFGPVDDDGKKQNRTAMGFLPGIVPDDDEKKGKFAETLTDFMHQNSGLLY